MQLSDTTKEFLTVKDLSLLFGLSITSIYRLLIARDIPFTRIGRNIRFSKAEIIDYLERNTVKEIK